MEPLNFIPYGVGGWLALLVATIIIFCPIGFSFRALKELRLIAVTGIDPIVPALYQGIDAAICFALAAGGIFTGMSLLDFGKNSRSTAEIYILLICSYYAAGYLLVSMGDGARHLADGGTVFTAVELMNSCIWSILWIAYLRKSKRVANTYGSPLTPSTIPSSPTESASR